MATETAGTETANKDLPAVVRSSRRLLPVDALRGLIIIFMALDHANHFVAHKHSSGEYWGGPFPTYADPLAFITRLVTHLSAPGFFFLMGAGMFLLADSRQRQGWRQWAIIRFFLIRGFILIALQFLVINRAWELYAGSPGLGNSIGYIGVLYALGVNMILASFALRLKSSHLLVLAAILFVGLELIIPDPNQWGPLVLAAPIDIFNPLLIMAGGMPRLNLWSNYPALQWLELVIFGLAFGQWLAADAHRAYRRAVLWGAGFLLTFLVLRMLDGFGNIRPRMGDGWIDFLNVVKYPPSMTFTLLTMGVNLLLLGLFGRAGRKVRPLLQVLAVYGRVPLFFYIVHLFLYAGLGWLLAPRGTTIAAMYPYWLLGLLILYPLCLWFGRLKQRQPPQSILRFV